MADHDQRFKVLLQEFFAEFLQLFFPQWVERFDFSGVEWLTSEVFLDPPQGERRELDLVARLPVRQVLRTQRPGEEDSWLTLIHVEIESAETTVPFRPRLFEYYTLLRRRYHFPVLPIALLLRVGLEGMGWDRYEERFWERLLLSFEYPYIGLPGLDAEQYVQGDNRLGVAMAALMRIPADLRAWIKAEALRRLVEAPENEARRYLLCECVQAYLPLEGPQLEEFEQLLRSPPYQGVQAMSATWFEEGLEKGLEKGLEEGRQKGRLEGQLEGERRLLLRQLEKRFGPLSPSALARLQAWSSDQITHAGLEMWTAQSLEELGLGPDLIA